MPVNTLPQKKNLPLGWTLMTIGLFCLINLTSSKSEVDSDANNGDKDVLINDSEGSNMDEEKDEPKPEILEDVDSESPTNPDDPRLKKKSGKARVFF